MEADPSLQKVTFNEAKSLPTDVELRSNVRVWFEELFENQHASSWLSHMPLTRKIEMVLQVRHQASLVIS